DGNFPADMNTSSAEGVAEERRLFYVALTRARRRLHVYVPAIFHHRPHGSDDAHRLGQASRYLSPQVQPLVRGPRPPAFGSGATATAARAGAGHEGDGLAGGASPAPALGEQMSVQALFEV